MTFGPPIHPLASRLYKPLHTPFSLAFFIALAQKDHMFLAMSLEKVLEEIREMSGKVSALSNDFEWLKEKGNEG